VLVFAALDQLGVPQVARPWHAQRLSIGTIRPCHKLDLSITFHGITIGLLRQEPSNMIG